MAVASEAPLKLLVLPGDGIGPEVTDQALRIVAWAAPHLGRPLHISHGLVVGASVDACGEAVSDAVVAEANIMTPDGRPVGTAQMTDAVLAALDAA